MLGRGRRRGEGDFIQLGLMLRRAAILKSPFLENTPQRKRAFPICSSADFEGRKPAQLTFVTVMNAARLHDGLLCLGALQLLISATLWLVGFFLPEKLISLSRTAATGSFPYAILLQLNQPMSRAQPGDRERAIGACPGPGSETAA